MFFLIYFSCWYQIKGLHETASEGKTFLYKSYDIGNSPRSAGGSIENLRDHKEEWTLDRNERIHLAALNCSIKTQWETDNKFKENADIVKTQQLCKNCARIKLSHIPKILYNALEILKRVGTEVGSRRLTR